MENLYKKISDLSLNEYPDIVEDSQTHSTPSGAPAKLRIIHSRRQLPGRLAVRLRQILLPLGVQARHGADSQARQRASPEVEPPEDLPETLPRGIGRTGEGKPPAGRPDAGGQGAPKLHQGNPGNEPGEPYSEQVIFVELSK